jgi:hypothetical protein
MSDALLRLTLILVYGPFFLTLGIFVFALLLKWAGKPDLLAWLIAKTSAQQPKPKQPGSAETVGPRGEH